MCDYLISLIIASNYIYESFPVPEYYMYYQHKHYHMFCLTEDGDWAIWSTWSTCPVTCTDELRYRSRVCNNPEPSNGGRQCDGNITESKFCNVSHCKGKDVVFLKH